MDTVEPRRSHSLWRTAALVSTLSGEFVVFVLGGVYVGRSLGAELGQASVGAALGGLAGFALAWYAVFRTLRPFLREEDSRGPKEGR
ncbi:MAG: hypothetical protein KM296_08990 [Brockia lithotrophica]|nr:hypothetical protein [Brockia lithotrophica]